MRCTIVITSCDDVPPLTWGGSASDIIASAEPPGQVLPTGSLSGPHISPDGGVSLPPPSKEELKKAEESALDDLQARADAGDPDAQLAVAQMKETQKVMQSQQAAISATGGAQQAGLQAGVMGQSMVQDRRIPGTGVDSDLSTLLVDETVPPGPALGFECAREDESDRVFVTKVFKYITDAERHYVATSPKGERTADVEEAEMHVEREDDVAGPTTWAWRNGLILRAVRFSTVAERNW